MYQRNRLASCEAGATALRSGSATLIAVCKTLKLVPLPCVSAGPTLIAVCKTLKLVPLPCVSAGPTLMAVCKTLKLVPLPCVPAGPTLTAVCKPAARLLVLRCLLGRLGHVPTPTGCQQLTPSVAGQMAGDAAAPQPCDVFISHRGPDTKRSLVSHLEQKLRGISLDVFVDYTMDKGGVGWQTILSKLRGAQRVLLVLSPGFEESCWCLEELRVMAERPEAVLPVFVDVETGRWTKQEFKDTLEDAAKDLRRSQPDTPADIAEHWQHALKSVSAITGWRHSSKVECGPCCASCAFASGSPAGS